MLKGIDSSFLIGKSWKVLMDVIRKIDESQAKEWMWQKYLVEKPDMTFNDYFDTLKVKNDEKSDDEILNMVDRIRKKVGEKNRT